MKKLFIILCLITAPIFAQVAQPKPTIEQYEKAVPLIVQQRNQLSTELLDAQAQIGIDAQEIDALKKQVADLQAKLAPPAPVKAPEPQPSKK